MYLYLLGGVKDRYLQFIFTKRFRYTSTHLGDRIWRKQLKNVQSVEVHTCSTIKKKEK